MIELIQNIATEAENGNSTRAWQTFFSHLKIKGNEHLNGQRPVSSETAHEILDALSSVLEITKVDTVINEILDGIHNLIPYINDENKDVMERYNAIYKKHYMQIA